MVLEQPLAPGQGAGVAGTGTGVQWGREKAEPWQDMLGHWTALSLCLL